jgi:hypothetical protein
MIFKQFVTSNLGASQEDKEATQLMKRISEDANFPNTEEIKTIAEYLYLDLDLKQTSSFQKLLMLWKFTESNFKQPSNPNFLTEINIIVDLQNNDPNYKHA